MNWFKSFWKGFTEPLPAQTPHPSPEFALDPCSNFTPRAQKVLALARTEAGRLHHHFVGTEHVLLGLITLGQGTAVNVLRMTTVNLESVRAEIDKQVGQGPADQNSPGLTPYTPRVRKALSLAASEARALNHTYVGTEHLLLGLLAEGEGVAARVLKSRRVDTELIRREVLRQLDPTFPTCAEVAHAGCVDTSKHYDVFCRESEREVVVYRNVLFVSRSKLLSTGQYNYQAEFLELEQPNGESVYVATHCVIKFCEHGATITSANVPPP